MKKLRTDISELEKSKLDVLLKEYELVNIKIEKFVGNQFLYTQGALALAGGYIFFLVEGIRIIDNTIGSMQDTKLYLQFLPFFVLMILAGLLYQYQRTIGLQGYKQYLECTINKVVEENLISYGHIGMNYMLKRNVIALLNTFLYATVYIASSVLAFVMPIKVSEPKWFIYHIIAFVVFVIIAFFQTTGYAKKVKDKAHDFYDSEELIS